MNDLDILKKIAKKLNIKINKDDYKVNKQNNIIELYLSNNQLSQLPAEIAQLQNLQELYLSNNQLSQLPAEITQLQNLLVLDLSNNQLSQLPAEITQLQNLKELYLSNTQLTQLPAEIAQLQDLKVLSLSNNQLSQLPAEIAQLQNLQVLSLGDNPLKKPPIDIVNRGIDAIRNYFKELKEQGAEYVYEAKLILVGEPGAGKTSLAEKLLDPDYPLNPTEPMTKGIKIKQWKFPYNNTIQFTVNIWDFGGQEIMHATHRYFLTSRSVYIILADNRKEDTDFYYWLHMVELFSVFIALNEKFKYKKYVPEEIIKTFPCILDIFKINLFDNTGLKDLSNAIRKNITKLPHVDKEPIPRKWVQIRDILESLKEDHISLKKYISICKDQGIEDDTRALSISAFLHDIGVILHFQEDPLLKNCIILNPHWATEAVYLILFDEKVIDQAGEFDNTDIERIWNQSQYKYKHADLLRLMINFELCYEIKETKKYIVPELLADKVPVKGYPESFKEQEDREILQFEYRYNFMPKGVISRLIVRMSTYIYKKLQWKNGIILNYENTYAEIKGHSDERKLKIRILGDNKKSLLEIIRKEINIIHKSFEKLNVDEMIPCICSECRRNPKPYFHLFSFLQRCRVKGKETVPCQKSIEEVNVEQLFQGVLSQSWDVFISYSTVNRSIINQIINGLKEKHITYWVDFEQIKPGHFVHKSIDLGLDACQCVLLCLSRSFLQSNWGQAEYGSRLSEILSRKNNKKSLIPLIIDDLKDDELPPLLKGIKCVRFLDTNAYHGLLDLLENNFRR